MHKYLAVPNPNFSIVVPTECNAACGFCFWKPNDPASKEVFIKKLEHHITMLPTDFQQVSITGGEPTTCDWLPEILDFALDRFNKIVLSSNGFNITEAILERIDHLNISRHHYIDDVNDKIFQTVSIPSAKDLCDIRNKAEKFGVDLTLNCVLPSYFADINFIHNYLEFAKTIGAHAVCFRKEHSDLNLLPVENKIFNKLIDDSGCPVCRTRSYFLNGVKTTFKYSVKEPSDVFTSTIYELIMQANGCLTSDWKGVNIIDPERLEAPAGYVSGPMTDFFRGDCNLGSGCRQGYYACGSFSSSCG